MNKQIAAGVVLLVVLAALALWLASYFVALFAVASASVQAAIIAGGVGLASILLTVWRDRAKAVREAHREKKIEIYTELHEIWFAFMDRYRQGSSSEVPDPDLVDKLRKSSRKIIFYGSPKVVKTLSEFSHSRNIKNSDALSRIRPFGKVLLAMREDIGLSNFGLDELSVQQLLISDNLAKPKEKI